MKRFSNTPGKDTPDGMSRAASVLVSAGEASGDHHAAMFVRALQKLSPELSFFGMGGSELRRTGTQTIVDSELAGSAMGFSELLGTLRKTIRGFHQLVDEAEKRRPALAVLLDYPDFNLRLAKRLSAQGVKVLYFISPQLWAWRKGRVKQIQRSVDRMAVIFPFEEPFFRAHGVEAEFVGHPFLDERWPEVDREAFFRELGLQPALPMVALLPGSRKGEVERLLQPLVQGFAKLQKIRPGLQAVVPVAPGLSVELLRHIQPPPPGVVYRAVPAREVLTLADAAVVASGTATVEATVARVPFVAVYKMSPSTFRIARLLVRGVKHFTMANLIAGRPIVGELLQDQVTPENVATELERLLGDPSRTRAMRADFDLVVHRLGVRQRDGLTAAERVARIADELLRGIDPSQALPFGGDIGKTRRRARG